ncbi:MAG TPA: BON domain-containing protein [Ramlibacter sp.]|uniref:BON domain-containing protein n=1 Tax=Ramlibacter sp. TaxID=1917967 RepID=UPI002CADBB40|nr:BON domain-containing protein [Ramlibacter sp.]HVZ42466.1 BON domain-containing protein [Ramlibacter sp.]
MKVQPSILALAILTGVSLFTAGCTVMRGQETVGSYVDDKTITAAIKAKMIEDKSVDAAVINVQTLNGEVSLSGFAKSPLEKQRAESIARETKGVRMVHNNLIIRR